jgi:predicted nucleotidyltransferase
MSRRNVVIAALRQELPLLQREYGVSSLSLFGSVARGDDLPESDVDLLVEFDRPPTLFTIAGLRHHLSELLNSPVDVGTPDTLRLHLRDEVLAESIRVA